MSFHEGVGENRTNHIIDAKFTLIRVGASFHLSPQTMQVYQTILLKRFSITKKGKGREVWT